MNNKVEEIMNSLSLEQKIGQMICVGLDTTYVDDDFKELIKKYPFGSVGLFNRNVDNIKQVKLLTEEIQSVVAPACNGLSAMIAIDEEGGIVSQFSSGLTQMPGSLAVGATRSEINAFDYGHIIGSELSELGITMNWSPVIDLNNPLNRVNDVRSFGDEAGLVSKLGTAMAKGLNTGGVGATAKHFPGLGNATLDSNTYMYVNTNDRDYIINNDLLPFREISKSGVDAIMTGPIAAPAFENNQLIPAAVSIELISNVLRKEFNYDGVIFAEDLVTGLTMYTLKRSAQLSISAGVDIIILCHSKSHPILIYNSLLNAVKKGKIKEERINESVRRIIRMKFNIERYRENRKKLHSIETNRKIEKMSSESIMVTSDPQRLIPVDKSVFRKIVVIMPKLESLSTADVSETIRCTLGEHLSSEFSNVKIASVSLTPSQAETDNALNSVQLSDLVIVATENSNDFPDYINLLSKIANIKPTIIVSLRHPFESNFFPKNVTVVLAFSTISTSMEIVKDILSGNQEPRGTLPVRLSNL